MAPSATSPLPTRIFESELPIPLISLEPLLKPSPKTTETAQALLSAFRTSGFLYLSHISSVIPPSVLAAAFSHSATFFARPQSQKDDLAWTTPRSNRGYVRQGREKVSQGMTKEEVAEVRATGGEDMKESFEIGREAEEGHANQWPDQIDDEGVAFRAVMREFWLKCKEVHAIVMQGIAIGMGLRDGFFDDFVSVGDNTLRLLHYPAVRAGGFEGGKRVRAGAHSDYGDITLLFQDHIGGLQVERPGGTGTWMDVAPIEGTIVINAGDLLARWSNDMIRSTMHRVVKPSSTEAEREGGHPPRYSVVYFCNPDYNQWIEALPRTWGGEMGEKKYEGINSGDYLVQRLSATY